MGSGRWLLAWVCVAAGCGGRSSAGGSGEGDPIGAGGGPPTNTVCKTSFVCPTGERCDDGSCVPDDDCPDAREPELLFEAPAGSPWAKGFNPYLTVMDGREFIASSDVDEKGAPNEITRFLDLQTGRELLFVHEPGYVGCGGTPARCYFSSAGATTIVEVELGGKTVSLREETLRAFPGYAYLFASDADYRARRVVAIGGTLVAIYALGRAIPLATIDFVDKSVQRVLVGADGRSERVLSWKQATQITEEDAEVAVTALESGAQSELIYRGPGGPIWGVSALPDGDAWVVLRDGRVSENEPAVFVYRSDGTATLVGTLDTVLAMEVDYEYRTGERRLEPGPSAYVTHCDQSGCGSHRFWFDPPSLEEVASVPLPEPGLDVDYSRRLACGGADLWVVTMDGDDAPARFWSMRIPGRTGFP
jgi:hypothetical protein